MQLADHLLNISPDQDFRWRNLRLLVKSILAEFSRGDAKILDLGCGTGHFTFDLARNGYHVTASDVSVDLVGLVAAKACQMGLDIKTMVADAANPISCGPYDVIICLDVLEHIEDDQAAMRNIWSALKPDGVLICSVPALQGLYGERDRAIGHFRRYGREDLIQKMKGAGFNIESTRYWNLLGLLVVGFSEKVLHKRISEKTRYSRTFFNRTLNSILSDWFYFIENKMCAPIGLTLIAIAKR
jgi:2-polyprenyl-3-methyl-5-hydroxy-6-metoxy-1,4-benzoquinol methylase